MGYAVHYVPAGDVLPIFFSTYDGGTGASITMTGLAVTDIEIYKDGGTTQRASDAGYTLLDTDGIDFDGITGIHGFSVDTSDNTDAGFYTVGAWFHVVVSAVTVDGQTVNFVAAAFRLMAAESVAAKPKVDVDAWLGTAAATPTVAGVPEVDVTHWIGTAAATPTVAGVPEVDVTHWIGTAAATPTVAGVPEVDITHIGGAALSTATAQLGVNVVQLSGDATAADNLETAFDDSAGAVPWLGIVDQGTAQAATSTTIQLRAAAGFADDEIVGAIVQITGGSAGVGQVRTITDYVSSTDTATVDAWTTTPSGTITYKVWGSPAISPTYVPAVNVTQVDGVALDTHDAGSFPADVRSFGGTAGTFSGGRPEVNTTHAAGTAWNSGAIAAATLAADTLTAAKVASDVGTEIGTAVWATAARTLTALDEDSTTLDLDATIRGAVGMASANLDTQIGTLATAAALATVDTNVDSILVDTAEIGAAGAGLTALASAANLATVAGYIDTEVAAIKATTDKLDTLVEATSDGYHLSANAIDEIPDAVWREPIANHSGVSGSTAEALNAAGAAGDPWVTALPGSYTSGQAGGIVAAIQDVVDKLDGMLVATSDGYAYSGDALENSPSGSGGLDAAGVRAAVGLSSANLDTQLSGIQSDTNDIQTRLPAALISGRIDATVGAMQADVMTAAAAATDLTTELQSGLATAANLATLTGYVDTEVAAIKAVTDKVDGMLIATSDAYEFSADAMQTALAAGLATIDANVDAILADTGTDGVVVATASKTGYRLSSTGVDDVLDEVVEGSTTLRQSVRLHNSVLGGKASGLATTEATYRDLADTKDVVVATVDADGNRSALTRDLT